MSTANVVPVLAGLGSCPKRASARCMLLVNSRFDTMSRTASSCASQRVFTLCVVGKYAGDAAEPTIELE